MLELKAKWETDSFDAAFDELEKELVNVTRGLFVEIFYGILQRTPQWQGRMVASWTFSLRTPHYVDRSHDPSLISSGEIHLDDKHEFQPYQKGSQPAIQVALANSQFRDQDFKRLGDDVFISNGVDHGEGGYSWLVENGGINLRAVNRPGMPVRLTLDQVQSRYADISQRQAERLKQLSIGA
jgi:hypothetical protein